MTTKSSKKLTKTSDINTCRCEINNNEILCRKVVFNIFFNKQNYKESIHAIGLNHTTF